MSETIALPVLGYNKTNGVQTFEEWAVSGTGTPSNDNWNMFVGWESVRPRLSPSMFGTLQDCLMKFMLRHRYQLKQKGYSSARETGTIGHAIIGSLHDGVGVSEALNAGRKATAKLLKDIAAEPDCRKSKEELEKSLLGDFALASVVAQLFWEKYKLPENFKTVATEVEVNMDLPGLATSLKCIMDRLMYDTQEKELWVADIKITGDDPVKFHSTAPFDPQTRMYRLAALAYLQSGKATVTTTLNGETVHAPLPKDTPVVGMVYEAIQRPTIRQKQKQSSEEWLAEAKSWYEGTHPTSTAGGPAAMPEPYWHRYEEPVLAYEFQVHLREADAACSGATRVHKFTRTKNTFLCRGGPGRAPCEFLPLCSARSPAEWAHIIPRLYVRDTAKSIELEIN